MEHTATIDLRPTYEQGLKMLIDRTIQKLAARRENGKRVPFTACSMSTAFGAGEIHRPGWVKRQRHMLRMQLGGLEKHYSAVVEEANRELEAEVTGAIKTHQTSAKEARRHELEQAVKELALLNGASAPVASAAPAAAPAPVAEARRLVLPVHLLAAPSARSSQTPRTSCACGVFFTART
ncbi:MAG: hypothetical protein HYT22_01900 [Candidatus Niyogibacteria bacterium]|nr:hypothetical protein [Candidatus Niyogibacteria bacterium]